MLGVASAATSAISCLDHSHFRGRKTPVQYHRYRYRWIDTYIHINIYIYIYIYL